MKINLSINDRLKLSELLADQAASFSTIKIIRKLREELSLSEDEHKASGYKEIPDASHHGQSVVLWDMTKDPMKEIEVGEIALTTIQAKLNQMSNCNALTERYFDLYEKFVEALKK